MIYKGYTGVLEVAEESGELFGNVLGLRDVITFVGKTVEEARQSFEESVDFYLSQCEATGKKPDQPYAGQFSILGVEEQTVPLATDKKLDILLVEYGTLRAELLERDKAAYRFLGWAGAVLAATIVAPRWTIARPLLPFWLLPPLAIIAISILLWLSVLNNEWRKNCAEQLRRIEEQVKKQADGGEILTWERRSFAMTTELPFRRIWDLEPDLTIRELLCLPKKPKDVLEPVPHLDPPSRLEIVSARPGSPDRSAELG